MMIDTRSSAAPLPPRVPYPPSHPTRSMSATPLAPPIVNTSPVYVCMNKHKMDRLAKMPSGYTGFDCNVCDKAVLKITDAAYVYRCGKCDYDVCNKCAESKRFKDVHFLCATCGKRFPSHAKLQYHSRNCRGPSVASPDFDRGGAAVMGVGEFPLMHSNVWETPPVKAVSLRDSSLRRTAAPSSQQKQLANTRRRDVTALDPTETESTYLTSGKMRAPPPMASSLGTYQALLSQRESDDEYDDDEERHHDLPHEKAPLDNFFTVADSMLADSVRYSAHGRSSLQPSSRASSLRRPPQRDPLLGFNNDTEEMIPSSVGRLSKRLREEAAKGQQKTIRQSMEISPPKRKSRREGSLLQQEANFEFKPEMLAEPVGIAAQRQQSRAREASLSPTAVRPVELQIPQGRTSGGPSSTSPSVAHAAGSGKVVIRAVPSDHIPETKQQPGVERKVFSSSRSEKIATPSPSPSAAHLPPLPVPTHGPAARRPPTPAAATPPQGAPTPLTKQYVNNAFVDSQGRVMQNSTPQPRSDPMLFPASTGPGGPPALQGMRGHTASVRQGSLSRMPTPAEIVVPLHNRSPTTIAGGSMPGALLPSGSVTNAAAGRPGISPQSLRVNGGGGAYLALPQQTTHRAMFVDNFLSGPWVRYFVFGFDSVCIMHYSLQPGRFGGSFSITSGIVATVVIDINSKNVLHVPVTNIDSQNRSEPHPNVQTFFSEEVQIMSLHEARVSLSAVVTSILNFANMVVQHEREGLTPNVVSAAFVHQPAATSVSSTTKFAYVRKIFPDPQRTTVVFRLSNLRSQVVSHIAGVDIRWQSDRHSNVGTKYYVYPDGRAEPFVDDRTGILQHVQMVLENSFRR
jgi:hypothetical protein